MAAVTLRVNGHDRTVDADPDDTLLGVLRGDLGLTGSKFGCGEGQCGACTVLIDGRATKSCITRLGTLAGTSITTIEGLSRGETLHPVQQAFLDAEAFQCGYCTSGMILAVVSLLETTPHPTDAEITRVLDRNLCRCGTFPRIVDAIRLAADRMRTPA
jgi:aerobic-type carbon monoxide dehydrogenase small subunit (CoxS/CutS family)